MPALTYMAARTQVDLSRLFVRKAVKRLLNGGTSAALPALRSICRPDGEEGEGVGGGDGGDRGVVDWYMAPPRGKDTERKGGLRV